MEHEETLPAIAGGAGVLEAAPDWGAIKEGYERGFDTVTILARRHGVKPQAISRMAHHHKWRRLAMEGAGANALEVAASAMAKDLQMALKRQLKGLDANLKVAMKRKNVTAADKLELVNATIRGLMGATGIVEKVLKINARNAERVEHLRTKDGGDNPKAEFERRLAGYFAAAREGGGSGAPDAG